MRVRAIERGYHGCIREVGDEFEAPADLRSRWWVPVEPIPVEPMNAPVTPESMEHFVKRGRGKPPKQYR